MKNIKSIKYTIVSVFLISGLIMNSACEDQLVEAPKDIVIENFYQNAADVEAAVNAAYLPFHSGAFTASFTAVVDTENDWGYGRGSRAQYNDWTAFNSTNINRAQGVWNLFYQGVRNANLVILNAPRDLDQGQDEVNTFIAEAKFLRAYYYFQLVRCWGGVPLRTVDNMEDRDLPKSSESEVYDLIVTDLIEAEAGLPDEQSQIGRPTSYAAKTMLADVYMHLGRYSDALLKSREVIDASVYSLVPVTERDDFWNIFGPDVLTSSEEIWFVKYSRQEGLGNFMGWVVNHSSSGLFSFGGAFAHFANARDPFYKNWPDNDLRKDLWDFADFGFADSTIVTRKFPDPDAITLADAATDFPIYRYAEVLYIFAEAEARQAGMATANAMEAINQVRRRGYGEDPDIPSPNDFQLSDYNDLETFIDLIIEERGYEFIFEAKRWFTLKRTGKLDEVLLENRGVVVPEARYLWPIPVSEMNFNELINDADQNPGY